MNPTDETPDPDEHTPWDITRDRGILSPEDRAFLLEHEDSTVNRTAEGRKTSSERNTRLRIRNRIYNALLDFTLIYLYLPERDRKLIFSNPRRTDEDELDLWSAAIYTLAFLYERLTEEEAYQNFEYSLQAAVLAVLDTPGMAKHSDLDVLGSVMVDIDTSRVVDLGHIGQKISREGYLSLTDDELEAIEVLVRSKSDKELHPDFKEDLLDDVEQAREMSEDEKQQVQEFERRISEGLADAFEELNAMSEEEKEQLAEEYDLDDDLEE